MKSRKVWMGIPVIMLVFTVVFGVILTSCSDPIAEEDLLGQWCTAADLGDGRVSFEFISGQKILSSGETYDYTVGAQNKYTFTKNGSAQGSATFAFDGTVLTVTASDTKAIKNGTYYKLGSDGPGSTTPDDTVAPPSANPPGGIYTTAQNVTLTAESGATIKYSLNNTVPSTSYTAGSTINIPEGATKLRAIATKGGKNSEELVEDYYVSSSVVTGGSVSNGNNDGDGSLRDAISKAADGAKITIPSSVTTITLTQCLDIGKNIIIEGNGVNITKGTADLTSTNKSLVNIQEGKNVNFSGVRFSNGKELSGGLGGAIYNLGTLTLESCIFDNNQANYGGAVYSTAKSISTTVKGCTFYNNKATKWGGAIFVGGGNLLLVGNLFYKNTASDFGPVVDHSTATNAAVYSRGYNVVDVAYGTGKTQSGWTAYLDDSNQIIDKVFGSGTNGLNITGDPINTTTFAPVSGLNSVIPSGFTGLPQKYIDGTNRTLPGAPGAVKP